MANRARDKVIYIRVDEMQISLTIFLMYMTESVWMV